MRRARPNSITTGSSVSTAEAPAWTTGSTNTRRSYRTSEGSRFVMSTKHGVMQYRDTNPRGPEYEIMMSRPSRNLTNPDKYKLDWFERQQGVPARSQKPGRGQKRIRAVLRDEIQRKRQNPDTGIELERAPLNTRNTDPLDEFKRKDVALANKVYKPMGFRPKPGTLRYSKFAGPDPAMMRSKIGRVVNHGRRQRTLGPGTPPLPRMPEPKRGPGTPRLPTIRE